MIFMNMLTPRNATMLCKDKRGLCQLNASLQIRSATRKAITSVSGTGSRLESAFLALDAYWIL